MKISCSRTRGHIEIARRPAAQTAGTFAADAQLHPVLDPRGNLDAQEALGAAPALAAAFFARRTIELTGATALGAGLRHRQEAVIASDLAGAAAHVAGFQATSRLDPGPGAGLATLETWDLDLRVEAGGGILESDLELVLEIFAARGSRPTPAAPAGEEVLEDVLEEGSESRVAEAGPRARPRGSEPVEVSALVGIGQDGVRLVDLFEPLLGFLVAAVAVGMELHRELAISLLDLGLAGGARDAEDLVIVARHRTQSSSSGAAATDTSAARSTRLCSR